MAIRDYLPFQRVENENDFVARTLEPDDVRSLSKSIRIASIALGFRGVALTVNTRTVFEPSAYDFERIIQAVDTDSYVKQAFNKYKELFWKEGWDILSENHEARAYLYQRIDFLEITMKRPFADFLMEVVDQLLKFGNAFVVKARADISEYFPGKITPMVGDTPIAGYYLIPTEQVRILRDKHNKPKRYKQQTNPYTFSPNTMAPEWSADQVIHLHYDRKTGRAFGTPFVTNVLDDVVALRQMEEDVQNLVHRELFPLYKYKIGTPEQPAEPDEIEKAALELENLNNEGGLILPHRHDVTVVGSEGQALDVTKYMDHFKERVAIGLGVAPHHLGMTLNGGNRSMTERLDTALYDKIKNYQRLLADMIRLNIFNELLFEGGFDPIVNPIETDVSDRCFFRFKEIDVDTQVKKETHIIQKYVNNIASLAETRAALGYDHPEVDMTQLYAAVQGQIQASNMMLQAGNLKDTSLKPSSQSTSVIDISQPDATKKPNAQKPAGKGQTNAPNATKGIDNQMRPANQFGKRTSPNIKRMDNQFLSTIESLLDEEYNTIQDDVGLISDIEDLSNVKTGTK
jgi:hypothetical protein